MKLAIRSSAPLASAARSLSSDKHNIAEAQAALAISCAWNSLAFRLTALANAANIFSFDRPLVAKAHAMLAMPCAVISLIKRFAVLVNASKSFLSWLV